MPAVMAFAKRPAVYLRVVFLLIGSALAASLALLDGALILLAGHSWRSDWLVVLFAVAVVVVPLVGLGLLPPVRPIEAERRLWPAAMEYMLSEFGVWSLIESDDWDSPRERAFMLDMAAADADRLPLP
ncbi:MAG: hypothetical protein ACRDXX_10865 [Stackebrandtia sp.]